MLRRAHRECQTHPKERLLPARRHWDVQQIVLSLLGPLFNHLPYREGGRFRRGSRFGFYHIRKTPRRPLRPSAAFPVSRGFPHAPR